MHLPQVSVAPLLPLTLAQAINVELLDACRKAKKTGLPFRFMNEVVRTRQTFENFDFCAGPK